MPHPSHASDVQHLLGKSLLALPSLLEQSFWGMLQVGSALQHVLSASFRPLQLLWCWGWLGISPLNFCKLLISPLLCLQMGTQKFFEFFAQDKQ